jgi:hypothetical protein
VTSVLLAAPFPLDQTRVRGIPVETLHPGETFFLADQTVRRWIRQREDEGTAVLIVDDGAAVPAEVGARSLTIPVEPRDAAAVNDARARWAESRYRDDGGRWHLKHDLCGGPHDD